jgi:hypothetical protein
MDDGGAALLRVIVRVERAREGLRMYANILLSTDGSDVARKGVEHGLRWQRP